MDDKKPHHELDVMGFDLPSYFRLIIRAPNTTAKITIVATCGARAAVNVNPTTKPINRPVRTSYLIIPITPLNGK